MKKYLFFILSFIFFCSTLGVLYPASLKQVSADDNYRNDLAEFLQFEQEIIDLNNDEDTSFYINSNRYFAPTNESSQTLDSNETSEFVLKRLIVYGNVNNTYGAIDKISYNNLHILCYSTEQETEKAFKELSKIDGLNVMIDKVELLEEYAENDYNYDSYTNWGAKSIDIGGYRQFLVDESVQDEIVVVVMDTGINTSHPMFTNRLLKDTNGKIKGFSYYSSKYQYSYDNLAFDVDDPNTTDINEGDTNKYSFEDDHSHGSHVAGIVCDLTPSNVKILPIKVGEASGHSTTAIFISAYLRVINIYSKQYKIACTNLSFSGAGKSSESEKKTFNEQCYDPLMNLNILPITSAGNKNEEINIEGLNAVVVSALKNQNGQYLFDNSYSNYGKIVDISAPGTSIYSAGIADADGESSKLEYKNGTSMASPQVAGVAALLYLNPNLQADFTASDIEQMLYDISLDIGEPNKDIYYGHGILNLKYFEIQKVEAELSFYKDNQLITEYIENENFEDDFTLKIECSKENFQIIYTTNRTYPSISNSITYSSELNINNSIYIYAIGVELVNNEIVARTKLYSVSFFDISTPIEDCFDVSSRGYLQNYTGNYTHLTIPSTLKGKTIKGIEPSTFKYSNIQSIILPDTLTTIGGYVFQHCKDLKFIYAPKVTKLFIAAFSDCTSLTVVSDQHPASNITSGAYFPELIESIGFAFNGCEQLESVSLSKLTMFDYSNSSGYDFQNCINLKYIYLPSIKSIPTGTFNLCENLSGTFYIGEFVESIASNAFLGCKIDLFQVDENNQNFYTDGVGVYSQDALVAYACGNENINYNILDSVKIQDENYDITTISERVMFKANLNNLTIPASILTIHRYAFINSLISTLYYNATNCSESGYWNAETNSRAQVFTEIDTIILGNNVEQVPQKLFYGVHIKNLVINSHSTSFASLSLYRNSDQGVLNSIKFNFNTPIDSSYLNNTLYTTGLLYYNDVNFIYSKVEVPISSISKLQNLKYSAYDGEYYIYSKQPLSNIFKITAQAGENGSITPSGIKYFYEGATAQFKFTANKGYCVDSIIVNGVALTGDDLTNAIENGYTFLNISADYTISVVFAPATYTISYMDSEGNALSQNLTPTTYSYGMTIQLPIPSANQNYIFVGWYDNINFTGEPITHISSTEFGNKTYYAKFLYNAFTIEVIQSQNGVISSANSSYDYGSSARFTFTPNDGYHVEYLIIDGRNFTDSLTEYTFTNITKNHTISAYFAPNTDTAYTVKHWQESLTETNATLIGTKYYNLVTTDTSKTGTTGTLTEAVANTYEGFTVQTITQQSIAGNGSTVIDILYNRNIYAVSLEKGTGIFDVIGAGNYLFGQTVILNATLLEGYNWSLWQSSNTQIIENSSNIEYTFTMPASSIKLTANAIIKQFTITIENTTNGTITPSTNQIVNYGEGLELEFEADFGYELIKLLLDGNDITSSVTNNKCIISNVTKNHTISAIFDLVSYNITAINSTNGTITPSGITSVKHGGNQKYTFMPAVGHHIDSILIDGVALNTTEIENAVENGYTFPNVISNHTIIVIFAKNTYIITATANNYGTITPGGNVQVSYGDDKTFTFEALEGYRIDKVHVNGVNVGNIETYTFINITDNQTINVTFAKITYAIIATSGENGSISPAGTTNVPYGEGVNYTFTANAKYKVKDVKVNNVSVGAVNSYSFTNVTSNQTISVEFEKIILTITVICGDNGTVSPNGVVNVEYGESKNFSIIPNVNYIIYSIELNGENIDIAHTISISNVTENQILKVKFRLKLYITSISDRNGTITPSSTISYGEYMRFDFYPNIGYRVKNVIIDNISIGAVAYYVFANVYSSHTIEVEYEPMTFNINVFVDGKGTMQSNKGLENISYGEDLTFNIVAEDGWQLFNVYINGTKFDIENSVLTINDINEDMNIQVIFTQQENSNATIIAIIISAVLVLALLTALLIIVHKNSKRKKSHALLQSSITTKLDFNNQLKNANAKLSNSDKIESLQAENNKTKDITTKAHSVQSTTSNPTLNQALEFVKDKQKNFISFCTKYKIDYENNYNNAAMRFYQAYLRSTKQNQQPKKDN